MSEQVYNYWYKMGGYVGLIVYLTLYDFGSLNMLNYKFDHHKKKAAVAKL